MTMTSTAPSAGTAVDMSSRSTAACAGCEWTSGQLTDDLSIRVAARHHTAVTTHCVAVLTNTLMLIRPPASAMGGGER